VHAKPKRYIIMAALWNRAGHYIFMLWFLSIYLFFPRLISAVGDWMSTILRHIMQVWNVLRAARWKYSTQKRRQKSPSFWAPSHNFVGLYLRN